MNYGANDIQTLSPGRAYRERIGMYLSADLQEAMDLGLRELVYNAQDEYAATNQKDAQIKITIDTESNEITAEDNMRGIPCTLRDDGINALTAAFLIPHSGAKYDDKTAYTSSVGCNGQGQKIVCHTAKWLKVEVYRAGNIYFQSFHETDEGAVPDEEVKVIGKTKKTGTKITYIPSEQVYGKDTRIDIEVLSKTLRQLSYFSRGLKIILVVDGKEQTFISKNGLIDGLDTTNALSKPFQHFYKTDDCEVELALQWVKKRGQIKGYANGLYMVDGGAFISQFKSSLTRTFNSLAGKKFDGEAIRGVLDGFVSVKVRVGQFSNQAKTALANKEAATATSAAITEALKQFVTTRSNDFNMVVTMLEKVEKAEEAANRAREAILAHEKTINENAKKRFSAPVKLMDCEKHGENSILYVTEGKSAKTPVQNARNIENEAVYDIRGKIIGALKNPIDKVLENEEVSDILQILGCGIFEKYNQKKLNFGKLLIFSDKDSDGAAISNLIVTLIYVLMPDFIRQGRLGRVIPPLYRMKKGNKRVFFYSHEEYNKEKENYPGWDTTYYKGIGEMSSQDMKDTMFNEKERRIVIYNVDDFDSFSKLINLLMGNDVPPRRQYIFDNIDFHKLRGE